MDLLSQTNSSCLGKESKSLLRTWRYFQLVIVCMYPPRLQGSFSSFFVSSATMIVIWFLKTHSDMSKYGMYVYLLVFVLRILQMDKASIIGDAIDYVKELQKEVEDIETEIRDLEQKCTGSVEDVDSVEGDSGEIFAGQSTSSLVSGGEYQPPEPTLTTAISCSDKGSVDTAQVQSPARLVQKILEVNLGMDSSCKLLCTCVIVKDTSYTGSVASVFFSFLGAGAALLQM